MIVSSVAIVAIFAFVALSATASAAVITVPSAGNETIQQAINNTSAGDTIRVNAPAYNAQGIPETVVVNQSNIIIRSVNGRAVVSANGTSDHVVNITDQTNVTLEGFEIRDAHGTTKNVAGVSMINASECSISNNSVTNISATVPYSAYGIWLEQSSNNNTFSASTTVSNVDGGSAIGIWLYHSSNNRFNSSTSVSNITATYENGYAYGIQLFYSSNNTFSASTSVSTVTSATQDAYGIYLVNSSNNTFSASTSVSNITASGTLGLAYGIYLYLSDTNRFNSSTSVSNITAVDEAYGIVLFEDSDGNNFTGITIAPTLNDRESYEFWSDEDCDDNVVTDMTIGNPTTISFTYGNGVWIKRVNGSERPGDPANVCNIGKYINASNSTTNSWLCVNFSYSQNDVLNWVDEGTLTVWKYNGTAWNKEGWNESRVLDTTNNVVGVNITDFSIFAPLGTPSTSVTIPTATGTGNATINTSSGYFCSETRACAASEFPCMPDSPITCFHGFFRLSICGLNDTNPETVTINFTFPSAIPTDAEFWKYNASNGTWYPFPFGDNDGDNVISITITDNGPGDHNPALGIIEDPNGIGWRLPPVPALTPIGLVALIGVLSAIAALTISTKRKRR